MLKDVSWGFCWFTLFGINLENTAKEVDFVFFSSNSGAEPYVETWVAGSGYFGTWAEADWDSGQLVDPMGSTVCHRAETAL